MKLMDLITILLVIPAPVLAVAVYILIRQGKLKSKMWPRIFGVGGGVYMFLVSMVMSMLSSPASEFVDYTVTNLYWSLVVGIVAYLSGRELARRFQDRS